MYIPFITYDQYYFMCMQLTVIQVQIAQQQHLNIAPTANSFSKCSTLQVLSPHWEVELLSLALSQIGLDM